MSTQSSAKTISKLAEQAVNAFAAQLQGELIQPSDARYDETRKVYNAMIDKRPALIARCKDTSGCGQRGQLWAEQSNDGCHSRRWA